MKLKSFTHPLFTIFFSIAFLLGCSSESNENITENPLDTGRFFFESILKGDFKTAKKMMVQDEANKIAMEHFERFYAKVTPVLKSESSIRSWKVEKWEESDENNISMIASHEMLPNPIPFQLKKFNNIWLVNFSHFP